MTDSLRQATRSEAWPRQALEERGNAGFAVSQLR